MSTWMEVAAVFGGILLIFVKAYFSSDAKKKAEEAAAKAKQAESDKAADEILKKQLDKAPSTSQGMKDGWEQADKDLQG